MGIPYYFREIVNANAKLLLNNLTRCDRLFLDFNSIIHTCSAAVVARDPLHFTNKQIFDDIVAHTLMIVEKCKPTSLLYIAIDGVAPCAKILQQRRRRYMSAYRNKILNDFKLSNNMMVSTWDSNCITPGTQFMNELDVYLRSCDELKLPIQTIISGHDDVGEGEHKIIRYIKDSDKQDMYDVVYGLDADLIMLSLSCHKPKIYLMRETNDFFGKQVNQPKIGFRYLDIDTMRGCVSRHLYNTDNIEYMYDYIFICFLLGNDFIPGLTFLKIKNGGLDVLCNIYQKVFKEVNQNLIQKHQDIVIPNVKFLLRIFEELSKIEEDCMKNAIDKHKNSIYNTQRKFQTKYEKFVNELEYYPLIHRFPEQYICPRNDPKWRSHYYAHLFGSISQSTVKDSAMNYIEGLAWTTNYYFNLSHDKNWFYSFDHAPCATDLYKYMSTLDNSLFVKMMNDLEKTTGPYIDSTIQKLMVLPPQSKKLVSNEYHCVYDDVLLGCVHYYPLTFKLDTFLKHQLWECIPKLPKMNVHHLHDVVSRIAAKKN